MKKIYILGLAVAIILTLIPRTTAKAEDVETQNITQPFISTLTYPQRAWLGALEFCESRGNEKITILDSNKKYSYGLLQFQVNTFLPFGIKYGILPASTTEASALKVIHDPELQERLAVAMIQDGMSNRWKNCSESLGDPYPKLSPK